MHHRNIQMYVHGAFIHARLRFVYAVSNLLQKLCFSIYNMVHHIAWQILRSLLFMYLCQMAGSNNPQHWRIYKINQHWHFWFCLFRHGHIIFLQCLSKHFLVLICSNLWHRSHLYEEKVGVGGGIWGNWWHMQSMNITTRLDLEITFQCLRGICKTEGLMKSQGQSHLSGSSRS